MLEFGFYMNIEELNKLHEILLKIINGTSDITSDREFHELKYKKLKKRYTLRYELNEQNEIIHNCKIKLCKIEEILMNIKNDLRITQFLIKFKDFVEKEDINIEVYLLFLKKKHYFKNFIR